MAWSFLLASGSLLALWIAGRRPLLGWVLLAVMELFWIVWSLCVHQYGLTAMSVVYGSMYGHHAFKSRSASARNEGL